jgi:hypothetical protein
MVNISKLTKKRLGELLVEEGLVKEDQIAEALKKQRETGELLGEVLVRLGHISEGDIARSIARQFGLPYIVASDYDIDSGVSALVNVETMQENQLVVLDQIGTILVVAVSGLLNEKVFEELERRTGCQIQLYVTTAAEVQRALQKLTNKPPARK